MDRHQKARKALRKSIKHWIIDIVRLLKNGCHIDPYDMKWTHKDEHVKCGATHCVLCQEYKECFSEDFIGHDMDYRLNKEEFSTNRLDSFDYICPLFLFQKSVCGGFNTVWEWFMNEPCLKTAVAMVDKLVECYNEYV